MHYKSSRSFVSNSKHELVGVHEGNTSVFMESVSAYPVAKNVEGSRNWQSEKVLRGTSAH